MKATRRLLAATLMLLALGGGIFFMSQALQGPGAKPAFATAWPTPKPLPEFRLTDQTGNEFTKSSFRGHWNLVFFGFTNCPDICPVTLQQLSLARNRLLQSGKAAPDITFVSVDPERDTPDVIAAYVSHFGSDIRGVTGDIAELRKLTSAAGIFFEKSGLPNGDYSVDHSAVVLVVNDDAAIQASFSTPHDIEKFVKDVPVLMRSN